MNSGKSSVCWHRDNTENYMEMNQFNSYYIPNHFSNTYIPLLDVSVPNRGQMKTDTNTLSSFHILLKNWKKKIKGRHLTSQKSPQTNVLIRLDQERFDKTELDPTLGRLLSNLKYLLVSDVKMISVASTAFDNSFIFLIIFVCNKCSAVLPLTVLNKNHHHFLFSRKNV